MGLEFSMKTCQSILWAMKCWDERFMGHEFSMNPIEVHFMAHENLVIRLPLASMQSHGAFLNPRNTLHYG